MKSAAAIDVEGGSALHRAALGERKKKVEQLQGIRARSWASVSCPRMLANFALPASKSPQPDERAGAKGLPWPPAYIGPNRWRYSLELRNAFTISDWKKSPLNPLSLPNQKLKPAVSGSRRR